MRKSFTAVIERNKTVTTDFATEPYECGWAGEARWFVRVLEMGAGAELTLTPQISADGLFWCDEGSAPLCVKAPGVHSFALREFGQWLRLQAAINGSTPRMKIIVYLALKE
jgi:hypothetical protein